MSTEISPTTHPRLLTLEILGGYLDGVVIDFAAHTTCIIGGKGSGETTAFELSRFGLAAASLAAKDSVRSLLKKNLGAGVVRVLFETKHGVRYVAQRGLAEDRPSYFTPDGKPVKLAADVFPIEAYGQDEIERVGEDRRSQLGLVDRLAGDALRPLVAEIATVTQTLEDGAQALLALEAEIASLESDAAEARAIEEQLKPLLVGTGADAQLVAKAHAAKGLRGREKQAMAAAPAVLVEVRAGVDALATSLRKKLAAVVPPEARTGVNGAVLTTVIEQLAAVSGVLESFAVETARLVDAAAAVVADQRERLATAHAAQDVEYDALLARQKEDQARVDERTRLQERFAVVAGAVPALEERTRLHARLRAERDALAERLVHLRDQRTDARTRVKDEHAECLKADGVRIRVHQDGQLDEYKAYLREVFGPITGKQPKWLVEKIAPRFLPHQLVAVVRAQDQARLVKLAQLEKNPERAAQVIAALTSNAHLYALQSIAIDDEAVIETLHGTVWKDTVECSPGQRCGAILTILLLQSDIPLLVDQPDDNVDPDFMCSAILPRVAALRGKRQFVFVTHHANVAVLSGSEQIVLIKSDGKNAATEADGNVGQMKQWIVTKLEGGEGAFEARRRVYEGSPP